jgi:hypothetical protein
MTGLRITSEHGACLEVTGIRLGAGTSGETLIRDIKICEY